MEHEVILNMIHSGVKQRTEHKYISNIQLAFTIVTQPSTDSNRR